MMIKQALTIAFLVLNVALGSSQTEKLTTAVDVLKKASTSFKNSDYVSYNTKYVLYSDFKSQKVLQSYNGLIIKNSETYYFKLKDTEFVTIDNVGLKINHKQKALIIENSVSGEDSSPLDLEKFTKGFTSKLIVTDPDYYICEFTPPRISQIMMTKAVVYINKSDFSIVKQIIYTSSQIEDRDEKGKMKMAVPRLEITYTKRPKNLKEDAPLLSKANYFTKKGNENVLNPKWNNYQIYRL